MRLNLIFRLNLILLDIQYTSNYKFNIIIRYTLRSAAL